jgi:intracellular multiplication protein IcmE
LQPLLARGPEAAAQLNRLITLQSNNAPLTQYTDELKRGVQAGMISPDMAACALQQYQGMMSVASYAGAAAPTIDTNIPGAKEFAALQQRVQQQTPQTTIASTGQTPEQTAEFIAAQKQEQAATDEARQRRIQAIQTAMSSQAQALLTAWQSPAMVHVGASQEEDKTKGTSTGTTGGGKNASSTQEGSNAEKEVKAALIKSGTIYFAVLDTAVDSDYPDTPVMATIVQGPFKGAKLLGKLNLAQGKDKVSLNFTSMDMEQWPETKDVSAFAIDPDTARTVLASSVDYHYMKRYGAIMAAAFVQGYSSGITQAGTSTTGIFGTSTSHPELSPGNKIAVGIGQIGTTMGQAISSYINTPTTVKVNSGVGIGILFTSAVTE